jgi:alkylated DNA repair dioxygenase AlkB
MRRDLPVDITCMEIIKEYGVLILKNAINEKQQEELFLKIKDNVRTPTKAGLTCDFFISTDTSKKLYREELHLFGEALYTRFAKEFTNISKSDGEPSLKRMEKIISGEAPVKVATIMGKSYLSNANLKNHTDARNPLYTMSLALGDSCDFTVGKKTPNPHKGERSGKGVTIKMNSGDAIFFDGGSIPHGVSKVHKNTKPKWFEKLNNGSGNDRIILLFREKYQH